MKRDNLTEQVRRRLERLPEPHSNHYGVVPLPPTEDGVALETAQASVEAAQAAVTEINLLVKELQDPYLISRVLTRKEAVSSSSIEGTHSTLDDLLTGEEADPDTMTSETKQVRDYAVALEQVIPLVQENGHSAFSIELIKGLHRSVMQSDPDYRDKPGEFRTTVVWIGGEGHIGSSTYNPPPPARVPECMAEHIEYLKCDGMQSMTQNLITRMAIAHAHFEAIHPFRDGNGRVGRLLLPLMMAADGGVPLYLSPYIEANKDQYITALKQAQQRLNLPAMIGFVADAITGTVVEIKRTRSDLSDLLQQWQGRKSFRSDSTALAAMHVLHQYPVITVRRLEEILRVSFQSASTALQQLVGIGVLTERTGRKKDRVFVADEVTAILNRPFGQETVQSERRRRDTE